MTSSLDARCGAPGILRPRHPAEALTGCRVTERGTDWATATMPLPRIASAPDVPLGWLGIAADASAAQSLGRVLSQGLDLRTVELRMDAIGTVPPAGGFITARADMIHVDDRTGLSRVRIHSPDGTDVALCTARFLVVPGSSSQMPIPEPSPLPDMNSEAVLDLPPLDEIFGVTSSRRDHDTVLLTAELAGMLCNRHGSVHGGLHVSLIDFAMRTLVGQPGDPNAPSLLDLTVTYQRPIVPRLEPKMLLRATTERRGRRILTVRASLETERGRVHTSAHGTFLSATKDC